MIKHMVKEVSSTQRILLPCAQVRGNLQEGFYVESMGGSPGELSEELVTQEKRKKGWRMNYDLGEATEGGE